MTQLMTLIKALVYFYTLSLVINILWRFYIGRYTIAQMVEQQQSIQELEANENHVPCIKIILFLPMLGEQENVAPLLAAINALSFSVDRVLVVPITTEREEVTQLQKEKAVEALVKDLKAG